MRREITFVVECVIAPMVLVGLALAIAAGAALVAPLITYWLISATFNI